MTTPDGIIVPANYQPRAYQSPMWDYMDGGGTRYFGFLHRRAGKDRSALAFAAKAMFKRPGLYWHVFPTYELGRKAIWNGITDTGVKFIDTIPREVRERTNEGDMLIETVPPLGAATGSIYQIMSAEHPDSLRGPNPVGVIFSEYAFYPNDECWTIIQPILAENGGWAMFITTPNGRNFAHHLWKRGRTNPKWFTQLLTIDMTRRDNGSPVVTPEALQEVRDTGTSEAEIQREYYCSFDSPFVGAIWGAEMTRVREAGQIGHVPWNPDFPVETWWDLGLNDLNAIWFVQKIGNERHFIEYRQESDVPFLDWIKWIKDKPYVYSSHKAPWDIRQREKSSGKTLEDAALDLGVRFDVAQKTGLQDQINEVRRYLRRHVCRFDSIKCEDGVDALSQFRWKKDKHGVPTEQTEHDIYSHGADAFRTGVMAPDFDEVDMRNLPPIADNEYDPLRGSDRRDILMGRPALAADFYADPLGR